VAVSKPIREDAKFIRDVPQTIRDRDPPRWVKDDSRLMEQLLARALDAQGLGGRKSGDMVLTGVVDLPQGEEVRYIIDTKMDTSGRGQAETKSPGMRSKIRNLVEEGEQVIHATLWVNANGRVKGAGLFRFYEGFRTVRWRAMEPLTEVSDMNDLAKPAKLAAFREAVLARLRQTDLKSYNDHVAEVAERFAEVGVADARLGYKLLEQRKGPEQANRERVRAAVELLESRDPEEAAAKLLGMSVAKLRRLRAGGKS
jgi:hypothetical protein